jgi:hypothetical protein
MDRLADGDEVDGSVLQPRIFRGRDAVGNAAMRDGMRDLVRARVRRGDLAEVFRETERGLPAPGACVPAAEVARDQSRDRPEQLGRVRGPVAGVVARVVREVILERGRAQISSRL